MRRLYSALPFPFPGDLPDPGIDLMSLALAGRFFPLCHLGSPSVILVQLKELPLTFVMRPV